MNDAAEELYNELVEKQKIAPPKINNSKKRRAAKVACETQPVLQFCVKCDKDGTSAQRVLLDSDANGDRVCSVCGTVADRNASIGSEYSDGLRTSTSFRANPRLNYMRERLSQWCRQEPAIPMADVAALRAAFNGGYGRLDPQNGVYEFDPFLPKHAVRAVINRAELASFKYTEKWLRIRVLLGCEPNPTPTKELRDFIETSFIRLDRIWRCFAPELSPGRSSLISYNFVFHMLLLLHSVEAYVEHSPWFPLSDEKVDDLAVVWSKICAHANWPHYQALVHSDGTVERVEVEQRTLSNHVFGNGRTMRQTTINLTNAVKR